MFEMNSAFYGIIVAVLVCSLVLNTIGIWLIFRIRIQRTHQNLILMHFSIFQILLSILALVYWISALLGFGEEHQIRIWSNTVITSFRLPMYLTVNILTFDRLCATKYNLNYRRIFTKRRIRLMLLVPWISWFGSILILASLNSRNVIDVHEIIVFPILDCTSLAFILYTYCYIYYKIRKRRKNLHSIAANRLPGSNQKFIRVTTAIIFSFVFLVILPDINTSITAGYVEPSVSRIIILVGYILISSYFITLPLTYIFMQRKMRAMFMETVIRRSRNKRFMQWGDKEIGISNPKFQVTNF